MAFFPIELLVLSYIFLQSPPFPPTYSFPRRGLGKSSFSALLSKGIKLFSLLSQEHLEVSNSSAPFSQGGLEVSNFSIPFSQGGLGYRTFQFPFPRGVWGYRTFKLTFQGGFGGIQLFHIFNKLYDLNFTQQMFVVTLDTS